MSDLGMSSLGSFLQMLKCNRNFVSNRQKFSSHLVEVYHRSCRCIAMSNNTSSRVPRVVVWWRCWCLVRYGLLPCHSVNKWREKSSFFDILGEPLTRDNYCKCGTQNIFAVFFCFSPLPDEMDDLDDNTLSLSQSFLFFFVLTLFLYYSKHHYCDIVDLKK